MNFFRHTLYCELSVYSPPLSPPPPPWELAACCLPFFFPHFRFKLSVEAETEKRSVFQLGPNRQSTLNKLPTELRCRNFVNRHRLSIQIGAKRAKTCMRCVHILTELPFRKPQLVVGGGGEPIPVYQSLLVEPVWKLIGFTAGRKYRITWFKATAKKCIFFKLPTSPPIPKKVQSLFHEEEAGGGEDEWELGATVSTLFDPPRKRMESLSERGATICITLKQHPSSSSFLSLCTAKSWEGSNTRYYCGVFSQSWVKCCCCCCCCLGTPDSSLSSPFFPRTKRGFFGWLLVIKKGKEEENSKDPRQDLCRQAMSGLATGAWGRKKCRIYLYTYVCTYVLMYLCSYVGMYPCMYLCVFISMYLSMYPCVFISMYPCTYPCMHVSMYVPMCVYIYVSMYVPMHACIYVCTHACMYLCIYLCMYNAYWAYKSMPNVQKRVCNVCVFRLSFHFACHSWWYVPVYRKSTKKTVWFPEGDLKKVCFVLSQRTRPFLLLHIKSCFSNVSIIIDTTVH